MASSGQFFPAPIRDGHYVLRVDWVTEPECKCQHPAPSPPNIYLVNDWRLEVSGRCDNACSINGTAHTFSSCQCQRPWHLLF